VPLRAPLFAVLSLISLHILTFFSHLYVNHAFQGAFVMIPLLPLSLSTQNYGSDALIFRPDRWLVNGSTTDGGSNGHSNGTATQCAKVASAAEDMESSDTASAGIDQATPGVVADHGGNQPTGATTTTTGVAVYPDPQSFSAGPRDCIGQALAKLELQVVVSTLVSRMSFTPGPRLEEELRCAAATGQPPITALHALAGVHVTLQPEDGEMLLRVLPRC
jgi:Cytochrome P450